MAQVPVEHRFAGPAGEICWFEWGIPGPRPGLLLLHATGFHARVWDPVIAALGEGRHIVAPDLCGHGRSYRPPDLLDWHATSEDIAAFVDACTSGPLIVAGHSMGGFVAARLAILRPDRVAKLVLVDPVILARTAYEQRGGWGFADASEHPVARRRNAWDSADQMFERFADRAPYAGWKRAALEAYCRHGLVAAPGGGWELACPPVLEASCYMGSGNANPHEWIDQIRCPATVVRAKTGERTSQMDFSISPTWPGLAGAMRDARDLHWQDVSHFVPMEAPERLAALIAEQG